uniref:Peptidase_M10 domain-containing protein n=1 Tax=Angiostrongylus cantonensis TaxID=6313 RepID=A0A158P7W0_ANGCA
MKAIVEKGAKVRDCSVVSFSMDSPIPFFSFFLFISEFATFQQYLAAFGYMSQPKALNDGSQKSQFPNDEDLKTALLRFQKAFLLYQSGTMDVPTQSKMSEYRCGNKDMSDGQQLRGNTATSSAPLNSWIILNKNLLWGYRNHIPSGISLYHTLLHEIGHTLGLQHNFYRGSIMYPMLKLALIRYGSLEKIPDVDKLSLRRLYGMLCFTSLTLFNHNSRFIKLSMSGNRIYCNTFRFEYPDEWMVFYEKNVYRIKGRKFVDNGKKIQDVFPKAPGFVNATVTSSNLILLFVERTIYGYEYDGVTFSVCGEERTRYFPFRGVTRSPPHRTGPSFRLSFSSSIYQCHQQSHVSGIELGSLNR